jgi:hypothetical protein
VQQEPRHGEGNTESQHQMQAYQISANPGFLMFRMRRRMAEY